MRRVAGAWHEQRYGDGTGVFFGKINGQTVNVGQLGAKLSGQEKHTLIAVHEAGHAAADHGLGLALGQVELLTDDPDVLGDGTLLRLGATAWAERAPRAAWETAISAMAGWAASMLWLNECGQMDEYTSEYIQLAVIGDHDWLLKIPTLDATAYLYGTHHAPRNWNGRLLSMDAVLQQAIRLIKYRWADVLKLTDKLERDKVLSTEIITEVLLEPGWARPFRVRGIKPGK